MKIVDRRRFDADGNPREGVLGEADQPNPLPLDRVLHVYEACPTGQRMMSLIPATQKDWFELPLDTARLAGRPLVFALLASAEAADRSADTDRVLATELRFQAAFPRFWRKLPPRAIVPGETVTLPDVSGSLQARWLGASAVKRGILRVSAIFDIPFHGDPSELVGGKKESFDAIILSDGPIDLPPPPEEHATRLLRQLEKR